MQMFEELAAEKLLVPDENHADQFLAGSSAFFLQSSVQARRFNNEIEGFVWDAGLPPQAAADSEPVTELFGPLSVVPRTDEETQRAGWTWIKWLTNPGPHATFAATAGYFPARYSAADEPVLSAYYEENPIHKKLFETVAPVARIPQPGPALVAVRGPITSSVLTEVVLGRLSADEAVRRLKAEADEEIQQSL
jgi:ABC-type glycerol-3-phosphate transport system substrate-binding protein